MSLSSLAVVFAAVVGSPAPAPSSALQAFEIDRIGQPIALEGAPIALALARTCADPWYRMSGIQLITCMIAHPDDTFGPSDEQD